MAAYIIVDLDIKDAVQFERYRQEVPALTRKHGGEYLVRGGTVRIYEGDWQPKRVVLFRFPSLQAIDDFMNDPAYAELKALRQAIADTDLIAVEGV
ncbi:MAG TPA: DUF1330 domain-containing protein [Vineibacter sp.]|nr:DUF1330 domain-containing protein [Vineibacter sp.]